MLEAVRLELGASESSRASPSLQVGGRRRIRRDKRARNKSSASTALEKNNKIARNSLAGSTHHLQHLSNPKRGHTMGGSGRGGAKRGGGASRGRAGQDADDPVRPDFTVRTPPRHWKENLHGRVSGSTSKRIPVQTDGGSKQLVDLPFTSRIKSTLRSWMLASVPIFGAGRSKSSPHFLACKNKDLLLFFFFRLFLNRREKRFVKRPIKN